MGVPESAAVPPEAIAADILARIRGDGIRELV
jgi:hypothetical protein